MSDERLEKIHFWLSELRIPGDQIAPASSDASFRRYFRVAHGETTYIVMDAPPHKENCIPFIEVATVLLQHDIHVPEILHKSLDLGFLLLSDLGNDTYLPLLNDDSVNVLYGDAMNVLLKFRTIHRADHVLPHYDRALLLRELRLLDEWLIDRHWQLDLDAEQRDALFQLYDVLIDSALEQPTCFVHRDFHSRNLMKTTVNNPGVLDFQDAVVGPETYDLASLIQDCYVQWPREQVVSWVKDFYLKIQSHVPFDQWLRWFDLMSVQRHFKAAGIFARLNHRDGKDGYLADVPRTLSYVHRILGQYPELACLVPMFEQYLVPAMRNDPLMSDQARAYFS